MTLLGAPILVGPAVDRALSAKIEDLTRAVSRLTLLHAYGGLMLLRNCFGMPKLLYILRTSPCSGNHLLEKFDAVLKQGLTKKFNIDLDDVKRSQANLPVSSIGLGPGVIVAGTFRLDGLRRIKTVTPELHPDATRQRS